MTVIINDFEIMVEPANPPAGAQPGAPQKANEPAPPRTLQPQDIERIIRHFEERRERLNAD